jgi:hypothetical protein
VRSDSLASSAKYYSPTLFSALLSSYNSLTTALSETWYRWGLIFGTSSMTSTKRSVCSSDALARDASAICELGDGELAAWWECEENVDEKWNRVVLHEVEPPARVLPSVYFAVHTLLVLNAAS